MQNQPKHNFIYHRWTTRSDEYWIRHQHQSELQKEHQKNHRTEIKLKKLDTQNKS